jgi:glycosyltransferase involved in cell wall biosynthesis
MACGLPVVAFDCPSGPAEIVEHGRNGLLVQAGDVSGLAAALDQLMSSPAERARLGESARDVAARLAPDRVLPLWDAVLRAVGARVPTPMLVEPGASASRSGRPSVASRPDPDFEPLEGSR